MDTNVNYSLVGAFVIALVAAVVLAIVWLSSGFSLVQFKTYAVYSQESVSGLSVDAPVEYNGVNVGSVQSIALDTANPNLVKVLLNIDARTPITRGTQSVLTSRGITGIAFIALKDTGTDLRPLEAGPDQAYPVIPTSPSIFMRLDTALRNVSRNLDSVAASFRILFNKDNLHSIQDVLANLDHITTNLAKNSQRLNTIITNTSQASEQLIPLIRSSTTAMHTLETQTMPITYKLLMNMSDVAHTLNDVATQLKQNPAILIRGSAGLPPGPGEKR